MNDEEKKRELLRKIAENLATFAKAFQDAAEYFDLTQMSYEEYLQWFRDMNARLWMMMQNLGGETDPHRHVRDVDMPNTTIPPSPNPPKKKLRYADYIEFSNYAELKKFEKMKQISAEEIKACDPDELMKKLMGGDEDVET